MEARSARLLPWRYLGPDAFAVTSRRVNVDLLWSEISPCHARTITRARTHGRTWTHPHLCSFVGGFNDVPPHSSLNSAPLWPVCALCPLSLSLSLTRHECKLRCLDSRQSLQTNKQTNKGVMHAGRCRNARGASLQVNLTRVSSGHGGLLLKVWVFTIRGASP